jgi:Uma2 family endonuclease
VFYPSTENTGETELQRLIMEVLRPLLERWFRHKGLVAHVGADTFLYYVEGDPTRRVAPDVYVFPGMAQELLQPSYKLWEVGRAPSFALEVVSSDWTKDYDDVPASYGGIGIEELVIYDPEAPPRHPRRVKWQVYRRAGPGSFPIVEATNARRVWSQTLGLFLCIHEQGPASLVRLAESEVGPLFPTAEEAERQRAEEEGQRAEEQRQRAQDERQRAQDERQRAEDALAELARLKAELAALKQR